MFSYVAGLVMDHVEGALHDRVAAEVAAQAEAAAQAQAAARAETEAAARAETEAAARAETEAANPGRSLYEAELQEICEFFSNRITLSELHAWNDLLPNDVERGSHYKIIAAIERVDPQLITATDELGRQAIHHAAAKGAREVVRALCEVKPILKFAEDKELCGPIHYAASYGQLGVFKELCEQGVILSMLSKKGWKPIHHAAASGQVNMIEHICSLDRDQRQCIDWQGCEPIHIAAENGQIEAVNKLLHLDSGLLNATSRDGKLAVHYAAAGGQVNMIGHLHSLDPHVLQREDGQGRKPIHIAAENRQLEAISKLLLLDPDLLNAASRDGKLAIHYAAAAGDSRIVRTLLALDGSLRSKKDGSGMMPIHYSSTRKILDLCLGGGSLLWIEHLVHTAARMGQTDILRTLCERAPDCVTQFDSAGYLPIHHAVMNGQVDSLQVLMEVDPFSIYAKDANGHRPLDVAIMENKTQGLSVLVKECPDTIRSMLLKMQEEDKKSPLAFAISKGADLALIQLLLELEPALLQAPVGCGDKNVLSEYCSDKLTIGRCYQHYPCPRPTSCPPMLIALLWDRVDVLEHFLTLDETQIQYVFDDSKQGLAHIAVIYDCPKSLKLLIEREPKLATATDKSDHTPMNALFGCYSQTFEEMFETLYSSHPDLVCDDRLFSIAVHCLRTVVLEFLLDKHPKVLEFISDSIIFKKKSPIFELVTDIRLHANGQDYERERVRRVINYLLEKRPSIALIEDGKGRSPLALAGSCVPRQSLEKALLESGIIVEHD